jgi:hypothetical protein
MRSIAFVRLLVMLVAARGIRWVPVRVRNKNDLCEQ